MARNIMKLKKEELLEAINSSQFSDNYKSFIRDTLMAELFRGIEEMTLIRSELEKILANHFPSEQAQQRIIQQIFDPLFKGSLH